MSSHHPRRRFLVSVAALAVALTGLSLSPLNRSVANAADPPRIFFETSPIGGFAPLTTTMVNRTIDSSNDGTDTQGHVGTTGGNEATRRLNRGIDAAGTDDTEGHGGTTGGSAALRPVRIRP